jgi:hypothetical protein
VIELWCAREAQRSTMDVVGGDRARLRGMGHMNDSFYLLFIYTTLSRVWRCLFLSSSALIARLKASSRSHSTAMQHLMSPLETARGLEGHTNNSDSSYLLYIYNAFEELHDSSGLLLIYNAFATLRKQGHGAHLTSTNSHHRWMRSQSSLLARL